MSTKITKKVVVNSPDDHVVFDGLDFTEEATVEITAAASVTFRNCRFYNLKLGSAGTETLIGNNTQTSKVAGYKIVIQNCFFGKNDTYNMVSIGRMMLDGSSFENNYMTNDCTRDDRFSAFIAEEGATYNFNGNHFEKYTQNSFQFSFHKDPIATININDNVIGLPADDLEYEVRGLARFRPTPNSTTTFEHLVVNANNNKFEGKDDRIAFCQMKSDKDLVLTAENVPTYYLNGELTPIEIVDSRSIFCSNSTSI